MRIAMWNVSDLPVQERGLASTPPTIRACSTVDALEGPAMMEFSSIWGVTLSIVAYCDE
jgi:hypothetical protein